MTTKYPSGLDTSAELPQISDNITEISSDTLNAMRAAIFAIEHALGTSPQGSTASLVNRLAQSLNDDGTFKAAALVAAGLIALPITNSMVGSSAAIAESKLDLDFATQTLQNEISSNNVDIAALQLAFANLTNSFNQHVDGTAFKHDSFMILLDVLFPSSTPPSFVGLSATNVGDALIEINNDAITHAATGTSGAHKASNISVDALSFAATNVQQALEGLDNAAELRLEQHRDDQHASGFSNWANTLDGYNTKLQLAPAVLGNTATAIIGPGSRNRIDFVGLTLASLNVRQGDVVLVTDTASAGYYSIDDVGPRNPVGSKALLTDTQLEIVGTFPSDGYVQAQIFGKSSVAQFKTMVAPTIHQSDIRVDSIQVVRPNAARAISLGIDPKFIDNTKTLQVEVGTGGGAVRTLTITDLQKDRAGAAASPITITSIVERINSVFQNRVDGNAFPAAAYRVGDELMLAHNWDDDQDYTLRVLSTGTGNFELGFDGYGANVLDTYLRPTIDANYYVGGNRLSSLKQLVSDTVSIAGQVFTLSTTNPLTAGVKVGHLVHLKTHGTDAAAIGTYFIISVSSNSVTVHKNGGVTATGSAQIDIWHDALPLDDFSANTRDCVINAFVDFDGRLGYNQRLDYSDNIANLTITDVSDNFVATDGTLTTSTASGELSIKFSSGGVDGKTTKVPTGVSGDFKVYGPSNIEYIVVSITSPVGTSSNSVSIHSQVDEEEALEICTVRLDGVLTLSNIVDKRLFGTVGLDEIREDYTQAYIETPIVDLRANGVVTGLEILQDNYQDTSLFASTVFGTLLQGGIAYVGGVRLDIPSAPVMLPSTAGTFYIAINSLGTFNVIDDADYTLGQLIDGYAGNYLPIAKVVHSGALTTPLTSTDLRYFINNLDDKLDLILDVTNRRVGNFASVDAALSYINNYPHNEKFKLRVVSFTNDNITIPSGFRNLTVEIDGTVGSITSASSCKITSSSISNRSLPHVLGSISVSNVSSELELSNLRVVGAVSAASTSKVFIDNCDFASGVTITSAVPLATISNSRFAATTTALTTSSSATFINHCKLSGQIVVAGGQKAYITGSIFQASAAGTFDTSGLYFSQCDFSTSGGTSPSFILSNGGAKFSNCLFTGTVQTSGPIISVDASDSNSVKIVGCVFDGLELSGTATIITETSGTGSFVSVEECDFYNIIFTTSPALICSAFRNNTLSIPDGNALIKMVNSSVFSGNNGFHAVTTDAGAGDRPLMITNNVFPASALGYNVDVSQSVGTTGAQAIITGNQFTDIQDDGILCGANTQRFIVSNNYFGEGITGNAINFGLAGNMYAEVSGNIFRCNTAFTSASQVRRANIDSNIFSCNSLMTLQIGQLFTFNNNLVVAGDIEFTGISGSMFMMSLNQCASTITISVPCGATGLEITGNVFENLTVGANLSNGSVSNNRIAILTAANTPTISSVIFSDNIVASLVSHNLLTWTGCKIHHNVYVSGTAFTYTLGANTTIDNNTYSGGPIITMAGSAGTISGCIFSNNYCNLGTLTISDAFTGGEISNNLSIDLAITNNFTLSQIVGNSSASVSGWGFTGSVSNVVLSDNRLSGITIDGATISNIILAGNSFTDDILLQSSISFNNFLAQSNSSASGSIEIICTAAGMSNISMIGNTAGYLAVSSASTITTANISNNITTASVGGNALSISATTLNHGTITNNYIFDGLSVAASSSVSKMNMSGNSITGNVQIQVSATMSSSVISGNIVDGTFDISSILLISKLIFSSNTIGSTLTLPGIAGFSTGSSQSLFYFNFAATWASSGAIDTTASTAIFPWGNISSGAASGVIFGGAAASDTATANNIGGGGINT